MTPTLQKLDEEDDGSICLRDILPEKEHEKDYHFSNKALDQLFMLRFLKSGNKITIDTIIDYLSTKNIRIEEVKNEKGSSFLVVKGLSLTPLMEYEVENENEFFTIDTEISSIGRYLFSLNGIIQLAAEIGGGKTTFARSIIKRAPAKLYLEIRPNQVISVNGDDFLKDDLALNLLYAHPDKIYSLFNIYKAHTRKQIFKKGVEELGSGNFRGVIIYDRSREEDLRFIQMAKEKGWMSEDDYKICKKIISDEIASVDTPQSSIIRLLRTPDSCHALAHDRKRVYEVGKTIDVSRNMNEALNLQKQEMLDIAERYNKNVELLDISSEKDLRKRYADILLSSKVEQITQTPVNEEYCRNLSEAYKGLISAFQETGFKGVITYFDVQQWARVNNDAQAMKSADSTFLTVMLTYLHRGYMFEFKENSLSMLLPSTSEKITLSKG